MSTLAEEIAAGLAEMEAEMPATISITTGNSAATSIVSNVPCVLSSERRGQQLEIGGQVVTVALTAFVRSVHFTDTPPLSKTHVASVTVGSVTTKYRLARIIKPGPQAHYEIDLIDPSE